MALVVQLTSYIAGYQSLMNFPRIPSCWPCKALISYGLAGYGPPAMVTRMIHSIADVVSFLYLSNSTQAVTSDNQSARQTDYNIYGLAACHCRCEAGIIRYMVSVHMYVSMKVPLSLYQVTGQIAFVA